MSVKTLQKTWSEIYQTFARLSALVTNAQANICCEDLCHQIHKHLKEADLPVSYYTHVCISVSQTSQRGYVVYPDWKFFMISYIFW